ncbi:hypothetical protein HanPI659440_Chr01g0007141 [Helianthus annuus]|nr:hypothetical protein HanPI659440_Chr01g0007141 [Helianthus annuus]
MQSFFRAIQVVLLQSCAGKMHTEEEHVVLIHVKDLFALEEYDQSNGAWLLRPRNSKPVEVCISLLAFLLGNSSAHLKLIFGAIFREVISYTRTPIYKVSVGPILHFQ